MVEQERVQFVGSFSGEVSKSKVWWTLSDNLLFIFNNYINLYFTTGNVNLVHLYRSLCQERGECGELLVGRELQGN